MTSYSTVVYNGIAVYPYGKISAVANTAMYYGTIKTNI